MSGLGGVLAAHQWRHTRDTHCSCGFRTPLAQLAIEGYIAHLEAAVLAWFAARLGEDGVREDVARSILADDIAKGRAADEWGDGADEPWLLDEADAALAVVVAAVVGTEGS